MKKYISSFLLIIMMAIAHLGYAQATYKIHDSKDVNIKLSGTSTLHDWEMDATRANGEAQFVFNSENESELASMKSLTFNLAVKDLKSDSKGLDKNAYKALKADEFKKIHYVLSSAIQSPEKGGYLLKTQGKLTVAGTTKNMAMDIHLIVNENNTITCEGTYQLNMTDYNVEPPSFMFGAMSTGDATTLSFKVTYIKQNEG